VKSARLQTSLIGRKVHLLTDAEAKMTTERWQERIWTASGTWRYSNMQLGDYDGKVTRTYQYKPTPGEARSDLQSDAEREHGHNVTVDRVVVCEVVTTHLFDA
jgi:hypothetical protein